MALGLLHRCTAFSFRVESWLSGCMILVAVGVV